jgi:hypothetical protein
MRMRRRRVLALLAALTAILAAAVARGAESPCGCACGPEDGQRRAGYPQDVACYAVPSDTGPYVGYSVGGGAPWHGDAPCRDEGTWGWDYHGCLVPKNVILGWWHGRRSQGGIGAYRTAGPNCDSKSTP